MKKTKKLEGYARKKQITDLPCVGVKEAAQIFGWSVNKFRQRYRDVLHPEIDTIMTSRGKQFLLTDVLRCAYPEADNTTIHVLAQNTVRDLLISRKRKKVSKEAESDGAKDQSEKSINGMLLDALYEMVKEERNIDVSTLDALYELSLGRIPGSAEPKTSRAKSRLVHIPDQPKTFTMALLYFMEHNRQMGIKVYRRPDEEPDKLRYNYVGSFSVDQIYGTDSIENDLRRAYGTGYYILNFTDRFGIVWAQYTYAIG